MQFWVEREGTGEGEGMGILKMSVCVEGGGVGGGGGRIYSNKLFYQVRKIPYHSY